MTPVSLPWDAAVGYADGATRLAGMEEAVVQVSFASKLVAKLGCDRRRNRGPTRGIGSTLFAGGHRAPSLC